MPIVNRVADILPEVIAWRRDLHAHPELGFDVHRTSTFVVERLREFGCDQVVSGVGKTGVVGVITGRPGNGKSRTVGLRADMDALPIEEMTGRPYSSKHEGLMHACGHDGHTAMLLAAARYLAETRNFAGNAVLIFQPAEEIGAGAAAMLEDGLMDRFEIDQVYGMHTLPGLPVGAFGIRRGPVMAATDTIDVRIEGRGGHPGLPHQCIDSILVGAQLILALQQILAQNINPFDSAAISFNEFQAGSTHRVIAQTAEMHGSIRTLTPEVREFVIKRIREVAEGVSRVTDAKIDLDIQAADAVVFNQDVQTEFAIKAATDVAGEANVIETPPMLGGEDFSFMARARPGAFVWCGNGDSAGLHHATYDFSDEAIQFGTSYWIKLVENTLAA
ncbi:amidohydrolase [Mesorhizobium sp. M0119]|uniref:amidohydrolase n=1 Tax=Mesorhizobium sp. M0119 TaxID=2956885 RepID=UPI00333BCC1F